VHRLRLELEPLHAPQQLHRRPPVARAGAGAEQRGVRVGGRLDAALALHLAQDGESLRQPRGARARDERGVVAEGVRLQPVGAHLVEQLQHVADPPVARASRHSVAVAQHVGRRARGARLVEQIEGAPPLAEQVAGAEGVLVRRLVEGEAEPDRLVKREKDLLGASPPRAVHPLRPDAARERAHQRVVRAHRRAQRGGRVGDLSAQHLPHGLHLFTRHQAP